MTEILMTGCGMKIGRRGRDMLRFVGGIGDRTGIGRIIIKLKLGVTQYLFAL